MELYYKRHSDDDDDDVADVDGENRVDDDDNSRYDSGVDNPL